MAEKGTDLSLMLKGHQAELRALAPKYLNTNRMLAIFIEASRNDKLRNCTPLSVLAAAKKMAELGTERVGSGGVHLVPFGNEMTVIPDWRLMVDQAKKAGVITHASPEAVYAGDLFEWEKGLDLKLIHKPGAKRGEMTNVYCVLTLPDGSKDFAVMSKTDVDKIRKRSKASGSGPWVTDYEEMAKKTVVRRALKIFEGASPELSKVFDADNAVMGFEEMALPEPIAEPKALEAKAETVPPVKEKPEVKAEPPAEAGKPASVPQEAPETPEGKQDQILQWAQEITGANAEDSKETEIEALFVEWGSFPSKKPETKGEIVKGLKNVFNYKNKWLWSVYGNAKKAYETWKSGEKN